MADSKVYKKTASGSRSLLSNTMLGLVLAFFVAVSGGARAADAAGTTYYLNTAGDDSNSGTSESSPWATMEKVSALNLAPGDRVLLKGGQTFAGSLRLGAEDAGTAESPVVVGSYGEGRAAIRAGVGKGISVYNAGGVEVRNLEVVGAGYAAGNRESGIEFYTDLGDATKLAHILVENVEASGFGNSGVLLGAWPQDGTKSGFTDVRIVNVSAHDNADAGIQTYGYSSPTATGWAHANVYVGHCLAYANKGIANKGTNSGSGIVLGDVSGGTIERSVAHHNGENNNYNGGGPIGIWIWDSNRVTIQHNESYSNKTRTIDGGGFDLDGGVTNSVMQYNYSHDNAGAGYLLYQYDGARPFHGNVVRYNISQNDGRANLGGIHAGGGIADSEIYNNTVYIGPRANGSLPPAAKAAGTRNVHFRNNLFNTTGGAPLVETPSVQSGLRFQGNGYWSGGGAFRIKDRSATYDNIGAWRGATGQEKIGTANTGFRNDPRFFSPGGGGTVGDADRLSTLTAYQTKSGSPLIDAGLNLKSRFSLDPGAVDFAGSGTPQGAGYDVGAYESAGVSSATRNIAP
ncbi:MAG: right-handed parallel beta-helix repeat-containing protein [Actinomycetota bacterium]|nr:right-handed parallel beta-helix repeat-containing protein [Actinomycetota bacterium]